MNIVLLGAPGAGKGTQALKISQKYDIPHISTGDIFRKNIKEQTPIGVKAKEYIDKGELVPDSVVVEIVQLRLKESDCEKGYLLDGFPRTEFQAEELEKVTNVDAVVNIDIDLKLLLHRLVGRRVCDCGASYHVDILNGKTTCDICGKELYQRKDDNEETVQSRLDVYVNQTKPLIDYYTKKGVILNIDGVGTIDEVYARVINALENK